MKVENPAIGKSWDEVRKEIFTPEEIEQSDERVTNVGKQIKTAYENELGKRSEKDEKS